MADDLMSLVVPPPGSLMDALRTRLAASLSVASTVQLILGVDDEDAQSVAMWAACDPHFDDHDPLSSLYAEANRLREFEVALYARMGMEGFAW